MEKAYKKSEIFLRPFFDAIQTIMIMLFALSQALDSKILL